MEQIRALTCNTLFRGDARARLRLLGAVLEGSDYDVVCLQEVIFPGNLGLLRKVTSSFGQVAHGAVLPVVAGGLVTLSRWPIRRRRYERFAFTPPPRRTWLMRKGLLITEIDVAGQPITVVNTHLTANMDDDWSSPANRYVRAEVVELEQIARTVAGLDSSSPVLVMGDFNVPRDSSYFQDFAVAAGLTDALKGETEPTFRPIPSWPDPPAIDQILVRPSASHEVTVDARLTLKEKVTLPGRREKTAYLSDHYGIEAVLRLHPR